MKNVTISMDEESAAWLRVEAAARGKASRVIWQIWSPRSGLLAAPGIGPDRYRRVDRRRERPFESPAEADAFIRAERDRWA